MSLTPAAVPDPEDRRIITPEFRRLVDDLMSQQQHRSPFHGPTLDDHVKQIVDDPQYRPILAELVANCLRVMFEDKLTWQDDQDGDAS